MTFVLEHNEETYQNVLELQIGWASFRMWKLNAACFQSANDTEYFVCVISFLVITALK